MGKDQREMFYGAIPVIFERAKLLRENQTEAEMFLWNYLSKNQRKGFRFKQQHPIHLFIADFYCHKGKLVIEVDGSVHNEERQKQKDEGRDYFMRDLGLKVLRFTNGEVLNNIEKVLAEIDSQL
jgi:very-short-patch-repair endonuclease